MINPFGFSGAENLLRHALPCADRIAALAARARRAGVPVIYVNDHFGQWRGGLAELVERCTRPRSRGRAFVERLLPQPGDYHVLKPRHSGFLSTPLDVLLGELGVDTVVLTGIAAHICVLFTAIDAYMRRLKIIVASDAIAAEDPSDCRTVLDLMERVLQARVARSAAIQFGVAARRSGTRRRSA